MVEKLKILVDMGVTIQAIANGVGCGRPTVSAWINGKKLPSAENETKIAVYLERIKTNYLSKF